MNAKTFKKFLDRDEGRCWHCGRSDDTLVPQHRVNRGMGGSKTRDNAANIIVICSDFNGRMEASAVASRWALDNGWKLAHYEDPLKVEVYDVTTCAWYVLTDDFRRVRVE